MISVSKVQDLSNPVLLKIICTPELFELTNGQDGMVNVGNYELDQTYDYLLVENEEGPVGLFSIRKITNLVLEGHIRILPKFWGTESSLDAAKAGILYVEKHTPFRKIITTVPGNCTHVLKFIDKLGFKPYGCLERGIIYNNAVVPLVYFEYEVKK